jgi:hypothetical protein
MTLFEWRYEEGWIWISENRNKNDRNPDEYLVTVDPAGWGDHYASLDAEERRYFGKCGMMNVLLNTELAADDAAAESILDLWRSMGSPVIDRRASGYTAPVFPTNFKWPEEGTVQDILECWHMREGEQHEEEHEKAAQAIEDGEKI